MAELYRQENGTDVIVGTIAVDVSSDPSRFPRYGLSLISVRRRRLKDTGRDGVSESSSHQLGTVSGLA